MLKQKSVYIAGTDTGYLHDQQWWFNESFDDSFEIFNLDDFYPDEYFSNNHGLRAGEVQSYADFVLHYGAHLLQRPVQSVIDFGAGGGWFAKEFMDRGLDVVAIEGTAAGVKLMVNSGIDFNHIRKHDIRRRIVLEKKYDVALCTEVAEHIECPFSAILVENLTNNADLVWFSTEPPNTNRPHYHHCNEQPEKFWKNLFDFYDFGMYRLGSDVVLQCHDRAGYIFYRRAILVPDGSCEDS